jgi:inosine-uridine nucleoside N-ribohydrolase
MISGWMGLSSFLRKDRFIILQGSGGGGVQRGRHQNVIEYNFFIFPPTAQFYVNKVNKATIIKTNVCTWIIMYDDKRNDK